jgi:hypothetical protein
VAARTNKTTRSKRVDTVRASRDGHQFHEAWVARHALGLLLPRLDLYGIAVEGLSEEDEEDAPAAAVEIADATFYYGNGKSERYSPANDEPSERFTHAYSLMLVDRHLRVRPVVPASDDVAMVASLDEYSIHDFQKRFTALSK